jgi:hypothetical protein
VSGGSTANTSSAVVELVRKTPTIWPKPISVTRPVAFGTAGPTSTPPTLSAASCPTNPPGLWATIHRAMR